MTLRQCLEAIVPFGSSADRRPSQSLQSLSDICRQSPEKVPVCRPRLPSSKDIAKYLNRIDESRRYSNHGGLLIEFQNRLHDLVDRQAYVAVAASGTAALTGAILAATGRAKPDRPLCLVPAYTFIGTVAAIEQCGFEPYLVDVDPVTWMLDAERCSRHPLLARVGLVVPVAPYGRPVPQDDWTWFQKKTDTAVVIDGAAAMESLVAFPTIYLGPVPVAVSFHATKSFCTGEGGAIFCGTSDLQHTAIQCLNFGYDLDRLCRYPCINGKMSEYHAGIGLAELDSWSRKLSSYRHVADYYREYAGSFRNRLHLAPKVASNYALFETDDPAHASALMDALSQLGVGHRLWYGGGLHHQPYCKKFGRDAVINAERLASRLIGLPLSVDLEASDIGIVLNAIKAVEAGRRRVSYQTHAMRAKTQVNCH